MKSYPFSEIYKRLDKERKKTLIQQSMRKKNPRKNGLCFITGCFINPFKIKITFFNSQAHLQRNFRLLLSG